MARLLSWVTLDRLLHSSVPGGDSAVTYRTKLFLRVHLWVSSLRRSKAAMIMGGCLPLFR